MPDSIRVGKPQAGRKRLRVPTDLQSAAALVAWAQYQVCRGKMTLDEARAIKELAAEFRQLTGAMDQDRKLAAGRQLLADFQAAKTVR